jgi:hypothetical protein
MTYTMMLSREQFDAAHRFLSTKGRPLEHARFQHAFQGASAELVLTELRKFQNSDGGFGHALEPDLRTPESSALYTSVAFQLLRDLNVLKTPPMVSSGLDFFLTTFNQQQASWRIIPEIAEQSPRAPWWYQQERKERFETFSLNPTAEILGYLYDYQETVPDDVIALVTEQVFANLRDADNLEMHEILCLLRLFRTETLAERYKQEIFAKVKAQLSELARTPEQWQTYGLRPVQVVTVPTSVFMAGLEDAVADNLNYDISTQHASGCWEPLWQWDDTYPDAWAQAKQEWSGVLTLDKLLTLKRFGRIEGLT